MSKTYRLEIVTPERSVYTGEPYSLIVPAYEGALGVMAGHAPLLCALRPGLVTIRTESGDLELAVSEGFMEVGPKGVILLADAIEGIEDINVQRAEEALQRAKQRLGQPCPSLDRPRAQAALSRAENRLRLALRAKAPRA